MAKIDRLKMLHNAGYRNKVVDDPLTRLDIEAMKLFDPEYDAEAQGHEPGYTAEIIQLFLEKGALSTDLDPDELDSNEALCENFLEAFNQFTQVKQVIYGKITDKDDLDEYLDDDDPIDAKTWAALCILSQPHLYQSNEDRQFITEFIENAVGNDTLASQLAHYKSESLDATRLTLIDIAVEQEEYEIGDGFDFQDAEKARYDVERLHALKKCQALYSEIAIDEQRNDEITAMFCDALSDPTPASYPPLKKAHTRRCDWFASHLISNPIMLKDNKKLQTAMSQYLSSLVGNMHEANPSFGSLYNAASIRSPYVKLDLKYKKINMLWRFTFKTRHIYELDGVIAKAKGVLAGEEYDKTLTLGDFAVLNEFAQLKQTVDELQALDLIDDQTIGYVVEQVNTAAEILSELNTQALSINKLKKSTGLFTIDTDARYKVSGPLSKGVLKLFRPLVALISKNNRHMAKVYNHDGTMMKSHIQNTAEESKVDLYEVLYTNIYSIDLEELIPDEHTELLRANLGKDYMKLLNARYQAIEANIHEDTVENYKDLKAHHGSRDKESKSPGYIRMFLKKFFSFGRVHKQRIENDYGQIRKDIFNKAYAEKTGGKRPLILCSQFVGMTMIAALEELDREIVIILFENKFDATDIEDEAISSMLDEKAYGQLTDEQIDVIREHLRENDIEIPDRFVKNPFPANENLDYLFPDRILALLDKANCLVVERAPENNISQFIDSPKPK